VKVDWERDRHSQSSCLIHRPKCLCHQRDSWDGPCKCVGSIRTSTCSRRAALARSLAGAQARAAPARRRHVPCRCAGKDTCQRGPQLMCDVLLLSGPRWRPASAKQPQQWPPGKDDSQSSQELKADTERIRRGLPVVSWQRARCSVFYPSDLSVSTRCSLASGSPGSELHRPVSESGAGSHQVTLCSITSFHRD
jgi:hypothetical protein